MRLCLTHNPLCTGLNPCEGCHAVRAQILAKSLFEAGYRDPNQLQAMFATFASLQDQARRELAHEASLQEQLFPHEEAIPPMAEDAPIVDAIMDATRTESPDEPGEEEVGEEIVNKDYAQVHLAAIMAEAEANRTGEPLTPKPRPKAAKQPQTENIEQEKNHGQE